jgi:hypothetical protein
MGEHEKTDSRSYLSPDLYDRLKQTALIWLPAISALYFGLGQIWGFPKIEEVVGSIAVVDTVLGGLVAKASSNHRKATEGPAFGDILVGTTEEGGRVAQLQLNADDPMSVLEKHDKVTLTVKRVE